METVDLNNVPIFSTGVWEGNGTKEGGMKFTESDLDDIVNSYQEVGDQVKPRLILGHDEKKSEDFSGYPSLGWIKDVRRKGNQLVGDIKSVPKKIAELIDARAYGRFSPGIWKRMNVNGKDHKSVLDHVGLLGGKLPANTDLSGFIDLYEYENSDELIIYSKKQENEMVTEEFQVKITELSEQLNALKEELKFAQDNNANLANENTELKAKFERQEYEAKETNFKNYLEGQVKEGKITPAQISTFMALGMGADELMTYDFKDGSKVEKVEGNRIDLVKRLIADSSSIALGEESKHEEPEEKETYSKKVVEDEDDKLHEKIKAYIKEKPDVSYSEAFNILTGGE